jgi:hypothetical protein
MGWRSERHTKNNQVPGHCRLRQRRGNRMGQSLAKGVVNPTGGVGRDPKGSWRINLVTLPLSQRQKGKFAPKRKGYRHVWG